MSQCPHYTPRENGNVNCPRCKLWIDFISCNAVCSIHDQLKSVKQIWPKEEVMEKYIGSKIIHAKPMTAEEAGKQFDRPIDVSNAVVEHEAKSDGTIVATFHPGYLVKYEGGYMSWSPKAVFEAAYRKTDGMTFGLATEAMLTGLLCGLPFWKEDVMIGIQLPDVDSINTAPYYYVQSRFGRVPWMPTQIELLTTEWCIREAKK